MVKTDARRRISSSALVLLSLAAAACSAGPVAEPPTAPRMPPDWTVVRDIQVPRDQIARIEKNLGGEIAALRNTDYEVHGRTVRINTILAADAESADRLWAGLKTIKSEEFLLRADGPLIYEFVGKDEAIPEMREGRVHLSSGR